MNTKSNKWILAVAAVMVTLMSAPKAMACGEGTDADVVSDAPKK